MYNSRASAARSVPVSAAAARCRARLLSTTVMSSFRARRQYLLSTHDGQVGTVSSEGAEMVPAYHSPLTVPASSCRHLGRVLVGSCSRL